MENKNIIPGRKFLEKRRVIKKPFAIEDKC